MKAPGKYTEIGLALGGIVVFLLLWELLPALGVVKPLFTSSPSRVVEAAGWLIAHGFGYDLWVSSLEFGVGFGLAVLVAMPLGFLLGWYRPLNAVADAFVQALNATPRIALAPLLIMWLGIGLVSKVAVVFLAALFPILLNTRASLRNLPLPLVQCARAYGARDRQIFLTVALPASVPWIIAGLRLAVGQALVGVVVAELIAASAGIGHVLETASATFQTDKVFVVVVLLAGLGLLLSKVLERLEARFDSWRPPVV